MFACYPVRPLRSPFLYDSRVSSPCRKNPWEPQFRFRLHGSANFRRLLDFAASTPEKRWSWNAYLSML